MNMMSSAHYSATLYNGRNAEAVPVDLALGADSLRVVGPDGATLLQAPVSSVQLSEPFKNAPRMMTFASGETLQVDDSPELTRALGAAGRPPPLVARLQASWVLSSIATFLVVGLLALAYAYGVPAAARWAAHQIPPEVEQRMGATLLELIDRRSLQPSTLSDQWRSAITKRFAEMAETAAPGTAYRLEFRSAEERDTINAFALPGGIIVLLDGLVDAADGDDQIIGVLGHELGHVVHRHSMQRVIQAVGLGALAGLAWGDFSGVAANVPLVLGIFRYSRDDERTADEFAVKLMRAGGLTPQPLIDFFELIQSRSKYSAEVPEFLSSHPSTAERIEWLRSQVRP